MYYEKVGGLIHVLIEKMNILMLYGNKKNY